MICETCNGTGLHSDDMVCAACNGSGGKEQPQDRDENTPIGIVGYHAPEPQAEFLPEPETASSAVSASPEPETVTS